MLYNAIVLAGGRSSRLGTATKAELLVHGRTLLRWSLDAAADAHRIAVVGVASHEPLPSTALLVREEPPFGGPAAGIAAGLAGLASSARAHTLVLACDMPGIAAAVPPLAHAIERDPHGDGVIAVDRGRLQPLAALYATGSLTHAVARHERAGTLTGLGVFRLIDGLALRPTPVPAGSTDDVDTWADATRLGAAPAKTTNSKETS